MENQEILVLQVPEVILERMVEWECKAHRACKGQTVAEAHPVHLDPVASKVFPELKVTAEIQEKMVKPVCKALLVHLVQQVAVENVDSLEKEVQAAHQVPVEIEASPA